MEASNGRAVILDIREAVGCLSRRSVVVAPAQPGHDDGLENIT